MGGGSKDIVIGQSDIEFDPKSQKTMIALGSNNQTQNNNIGYEFKGGKFLA